ncbi:MAG TPA: SDR family oxidoreductase [Chloroflexota bacterium]|nr:SDR family oxidoreductase [Chloroflexota bacterium]
MDLGLAGKAAIVTGGSAGIGRGVALRLAQEGARVAICARRAEPLEEAADALREQTGGDVLPVAADVSKADDVRRLIEAAVERFGRLDILVNNAGTSSASPFADVDDGVWQEDLDLKLFAAIRTIRLAVPHLARAGGGSIVNVVNIGAKAPPARSLPTTVSRAAGVALTKALSKEFAAQQIRVNAVCIGLVKSDQWVRRARALGITLEEYYERTARERAIPLGRVAEAEEVGDLIAFLCSERGRYITGTAINFDGGSSAVV